MLFYLILVSLGILTILVRPLGLYCILVPLSNTVNVEVNEYSSRILEIGLLKPGFWLNPWGTLVEYEIMGCINIKNFEMEYL